MRYQSEEVRCKSSVRKLDFVKTRTLLPATKMVTVQAVMTGPRHTPPTITVEPRNLKKPRAVRTAQRPAPVHVPPQTSEAVGMDDSLGAARPRLDAETEPRVVPFWAKSPRMEWYHALEAERAKRVSETARVVSQLLTEALQRAEKAMTLPQLSLALAAISTEIVSGRRKPDLRGRIERILLDISEDEFHDERLDEHDSYYSDD